MKETVCVTGGSGGIGHALLAQLVDRYRVKALFRTKSVTSDVWERRGCTAVWGDLGDQAALSELVTDAKLVFHCAALVSQAAYAEAYAVNVEGTRRLAHLAASHGCQRFVYISSIAVYSGTPTDGDYTEDLELQCPDDMAVYSLTKLQSEKALKEVAVDTGLEYVILRPTSVYGPHTKPHTLIPIDLIRKGIPPIIGDGNGLTDAVYVDDVAKALVLAAHSPRANRETFNIGHEAVTYNDFYSYYSAMLNRQARHAPAWLIGGLVRLLEIAPGSIRTKTSDLRKGARLLLQMSRNSKRYPCDKAKALLGYTPELGLLTGMLKTELWLKRESLVPATRYALEEYGPLPFRPVAAVHPTNEDELVQIVRIASENGVKARAIGSLHSSAPVPYTDGVCIVLDRYRKLLKVDGPLVTVQGGMKVRELNDTLAGLKLALPINGAITAQSISGAISTGTHGGSIVYGSLSDTVEAVRLVKADGNVIELDRSDDRFPAVVVSCGLLGVMSTVTLRCVPAFVLQSRNSVGRAAEVIETFDEIHRRSPYTCIFYFPVTDQMEILDINRVENMAVDSVANEGRKTAAKRQPFANTPAGRFTIKLIVKTLVSLLLRHNAVQRTLTKFFVGSAYHPKTSRSDRVLAMMDVETSGRSPALVQDMEVAVPYERAPAAIAALRNHFLTTGKYPLIPIHIRCSARSSLWLSPAYKRDTCFLEFWQFPAAEHHFADVHRLLAPFGYRFHWGKDTRADPFYIQQQYERWDDFVALREQWDPTGMFLNEYLQGFFSKSGSLIARPAALLSE